MAILEERVRAKLKRLLDELDSLISPQKEEEEGREEDSLGLILPEAALKKGVPGLALDRGESVTIFTSTVLAHQITTFLKRRGLRAIRRGSMVIADKEARFYVRERMLPRSTLDLFEALPESIAAKTYSIVKDIYEKGAAIIDGIPPLSVLQTARDLLSAFGVKLALKSEIEGLSEALGFAEPGEDALLVGTDEDCHIRILDREYEARYVTASFPKVEMEVAETAPKGSVLFLPKPFQIFREFFGDVRIAEKLEELGGEVVALPNLLDELVAKLLVAEASARGARRVVIVKMPDLMEDEE